MSSAAIVQKSGTTATSSRSWSISKSCRRGQTLSNPPVLAADRTIQHSAGVKNHERLSHQYFFSEEDGGYIADIPDLDSCSVFGRTPEEALAEVERAKTAWLNAAERSGKPIPKPRYRPIIYQVVR